VIAKKSQLLIVFFVSIFSVLICGCAAFFDSVREATPNQDGTTAPVGQPDALRASVERYRLLALRYEKNQQFYKAVFMWRVVQKLSPDDRHAGYRIRELEKLIRTEADKHFLKGADYTKQKSFLSARNEFLMALAYDPNQKNAIDSLRNEIASSNYTIYETKQGDTMKKIAQKVYHDPEKYYIVAYFGRLSDDADLKPGIVLKLPIIKAEPELKQKHSVRHAPPVYRE
jgi:LysM repeat protein